MLQYSVRKNFLLLPSIEFSPTQLMSLKGLPLKGGDTSEALPDCSLIGFIPQRLRLRSFQSWTDNGARSGFLLLHFSMSVCMFPPYTEITSRFAWEDHMLRSIQTLTLAACWEGMACRGDSKWQCSFTEMQMLWRGAIPSQGRKMCLACPELRRKAGGSQQGACRKTSETSEQLPTDKLSETASPC